MSRLDRSHPDGSPDVCSENFKISGCRLTL
jgi:hypothetical protein